MNGRGRVTALFEVNEPQSNTPVLQLWTDCADARSSVYIPRDGARPPVGQEIAWSTHHVSWPGARVRKIGFAFDPTAPLN